MRHLLTSSRYYDNIPIASESEDAHLLTSSSYYVNIVNVLLGNSSWLLLMYYLDLLLSAFAVCLSI